MDDPQQLEFDSILEDYPVRLQAFEGPLDLLLHLIRKHEVDIYDIPIALVTQQYLEYLDLMQELVRRLLEHQRFKAAAELLHEREIQRGAQWGRPDGRVAEIVGEPPEPEVEVDLFSLMAAFRQVLERAKHRPRVLLPPEQISIETRIEQLLARLSDTEACGFDELFADADTRAGMIVTFLALLEMTRLRMTRMFQVGPYTPIHIELAVQEDPDPQAAAGEPPRGQTTDDDE